MFRIFFICLVCSWVKIIVFFEYVEVLCLVYFILLFILYWKRGSLSKYNEKILVGYVLKNKLIFNLNKLVCLLVLEFVFLWFVKIVNILKFLLMNKKIFLSVFLGNGFCG